MKKLVLTNDAGDVAHCGTVAEIEQVADALIAARPSLQVIDATCGDLCYYPSQVGYFWPENMGGKREPGPNARLVETGHDPLGIVYARLRSSACMRR